MVLVDIKMGYQEIQVDNLINSNLGFHTASYFSKNYFRYLDDIFLIWRRDLEGLEFIKSLMNGVDKKIKFTFESSDDNPSNSIPYLDVELYIQNGKIITDIYSKNTDSYNYLPFSSCHPRHCVTNIPYSLARRIKGIVSDPSKIDVRMLEMKNRLVAKGYPHDIIEDGISKAHNLSREEILNSKKNTNTDDTANNVYFVSTYNTSVDNSGAIIRSTVDNLNSSRQNMPKIKVKSSYRRPPNLKDHLMYRSTTNKRVRKCGKDCIFCSFLHEGPSITLKNGTSVTTNGNFECSSRNVIYVAVCSGCDEYYIGETGDKLSTRWTTHHQQSKLAPSQAPVQADVHFRICGDNQYKVFPFYRPRKNDTYLRRRYETHFILKFCPKLNGRLYD